MGKTASRSDAKRRADKKFEKKMQFYELVRDTVSQKAISKDKQQKRRSRQKKLSKAFDLSALSDYLPELKHSKERSNEELKFNNKRRNQLVIKEGSMMKAVVEHPVFRSDPFGSLYEYLLKTTRPPPSDPKPPDKRRNDDGVTTTKKKKKKHKKKTSEETTQVMVE